MRGFHQFDTIPHDWVEIVASSEGLARQNEAGINRDPGERNRSVGDVNRVLTEGDLGFIKSYLMKKASGTLSAAAADEE